MNRFPELDKALQSVDAFYKERGIFQGKFGFGTRPAIVVVDFAYGWTDEGYAGGSRNLDEPVRQTAALLKVARETAARGKPIPIIYTTSPWHPQTGDQPFKSAADPSRKFKPWDARACEIDDRVAPRPEDLVLLKENASAFFGTHLVAYLVQHQVDTLLITGCSTSACIRATATDAKSYRFKPVILRECVGDRSELLHEFTLFDIQSRFADVVNVKAALTYLQGL